ncbi:hypothetical protein QBC44DRAFT_370605 [Cladorrhinum sp. PSN332]|nr:hypothetical protein QBC44DRAFT_370605 [Cladorrhinum sp. PSN332]
MVTFEELPLEMVKAVMDLLCPLCSLRSRRSRTLVWTLLDLYVTSNYNPNPNV